MAPPDRKTQTTTMKLGKKTLAGVIGSVAAAAALFVMVAKEESGRQVKATVNADQTVTVTHVAGKQYLDAYLDIVKVPTACDGITKGVKMGMRFTPASATTCWRRSSSRTPSRSSAACQR